VRTQPEPEEAYQKVDVKKRKKRLEGTGQEQRLIPQERALPEIGQISAVGLPETISNVWRERSSRIYLIG
jgi:hypothetical protein